MICNMLAVHWFLGSLSKLKLKISVICRVSNQARVSFFGTHKVANLTNLSDLPTSGLLTITALEEFDQKLPRTSEIFSLCSP